MAPAASFQDVQAALPPSKKSLFDTLVGTFVETSEGGYSVWLKIPKTLARLRSSLFSVWLAPLRFTHPTLFRSTPAGSEYRACSTSGFAPLIPRGTVVPFKACFDPLRGSWRWLRCTGSAARLRAVLSVLFVVSVVSVLFSARAALAPLRSSYALSFDPLGVVI